MRVMHKDLRETHMVGADTAEKIIDPLISPLMLTLRIGLAGVSDAGEAFDMVRLNPHFGHCLACFAGSGNVLINNRWRRCEPGMAYLTPPGQVHAYRTVPGSRWGFAWIWWTAPRNQSPL